MATVQRLCIPYSKDATNTSTVLCSTGEIGQAEKWINIERRRVKKKGLPIVRPRLTLHPMCAVAGLTQAKRETQQTPPNTLGLGQLAYCKIEVTEPPAGKVDPPPFLVWSYVCICCCSAVPSNFFFFFKMCRLQPSPSLVYTMPISFLTFFHLGR